MTGPSPRSTQGRSLRSAAFVALFAAVLAPLLWFFIRETPPAGFYALAVVIVAVASWECYRMLEVTGSRPFKWLGVAAGQNCNPPRWHETANWYRADLAPFTQNPGSR